MAGLADEVVVVAADILSRSNQNNFEVLRVLTNSPMVPWQPTSRGFVLGEDIRSRHKVKLLLDSIYKTCSRWPILIGRSSKKQLDPLEESPFMRFGGKKPGGTRVSRVRRPILMNSEKELRVGRVCVGNWLLDSFH